MTNPPDHCLFLNIKVSPPSGPATLGALTGLPSSLGAPAVPNRSPTARFVLSNRSPTLDDGAGAFLSPTVSLSLALVGLVGLGLGLGLDD